MLQKTLPNTMREALGAAGRRCRTIAALLIAGLWFGRSFSDVETCLEALPMRRQVAFVVGTLGLLVFGAFIAAHAGLVGLLVYLLGVIVVAR